MRVMRGGLFPHHVLSSNIRLQNGVKIFLKEYLYFHAVSLVDNWTSSLANTGPLNLSGLSGLRPKIGFLMDRLGTNTRKKLGSFDHMDVMRFMKYSYLL